jgi:putative transposase
VLTLCHHLYNAAVSERREAWRMRGVVTSYQRQAELPAIKEAAPEYADVSVQVLQDLMLSVSRAFEAYFQRLRDGATGGYPRLQGRDRHHSFTSPHGGTHGSARLDNGFVILSKLERIADRSSGALKTVTRSREAHGWWAYFSCVHVPIQPLPQTGQEMGIDHG